jgi:outer membrane protein OmpA-like peptidoglycan-associated protein
LSQRKQFALQRSNNKKHINQTRRLLMKRFILCTLLVVAFGVYSHVQAQFKESGLAWGLSAGGAKGDNNANDRWVMQYRGFLQYGIPMLIGQFGIGYAEFAGPRGGSENWGYSTETFLIDLRLLFSPFSLENLHPYVYAGLGASKDLNLNGSDYLGMIPFGLGLQARVSRGVLLTAEGGYTLSASDKFDKHLRSNSDLNSFTNGKNDGFYGFTVGLAFTIGKNKEDVEAEALRLKQQADADAEARRVKEATDAEARRIKEATDAEARRIKDSTNAAAEAVRVKGANIAEAQRIKDSTNAAALRLAQQKSNDTVFVLIKGKTVVLRGVNFEFNKATLTKDSERILWRAYNAMVANPEVAVVITGHTDNVGSQKYNQVLSLKRAQAVKNWLVEQGIASNRMRTVGRGLNEPVASNETDAGRAENRRIEFYVEK